MTVRGSISGQALPSCHLLQPFKLWSGVWCLVGALEAVLSVKENWNFKSRTIPICTGAIWHSKERQANQWIDSIFTCFLKAIIRGRRLVKSLRAKKERNYEAKEHQAIWTNSIGHPDTLLIRILTFESVVEGSRLEFGKSEGAVARYGLQGARNHRYPSKVRSYTKTTRQRRVFPSSHWSMPLSPLTSSSRSASILDLAKRPAVRWEERFFARRSRNWTLRSKDWPASTDWPP